MKELSLFLVKNSFGAKMKNGFRNLCNGESSTSTLDQQKVDHVGSMLEPHHRPSLVNSPLRESRLQPTLEEMILQLEMEEKMARKGGVLPHRMSCVNSSDILRSARNAALNQYPRFSLDGKDAMYRSSFTNLHAPIRAAAGKLNYSQQLEEESIKNKNATKLPGVIGGESVIWCKPGVVAKLMGLDAMPIPLNSNIYRRERLSAIIKRQNLLKRAQRHEMERRRGGVVGSCSRSTGYCVMKPVELEIPDGKAGWPIRRFL